MQDYQIFESIRKHKKGGTLLGIHSGLEPIQINKYNDTFELLIVEVKVGSKNIRIITGYGPQECWDSNKRIPFCYAIDEEVSASELLGKSVIIAMDANSKLGPHIIPGDPYKQSPNGKLPAGIFNSHALCVVNGLTEKRKGIITR